MNKTLTKYQIFIQKLNSKKLKQKEPLKNHTYFKIGGPADLFYPAETQQELIKATRLAQELNIPFTVLGGGSNVLVIDKGYRGLIILNKTKKISFTSKANHTLVKAQSGATFNQLINYSINKALKGLEVFLGLPGTVGGAIFNNSHHLDELIGDRVSAVTVIDKKGEIKAYSQKDLNFAYDYSALQETKEIVLSATFKLKKGRQKKLRKIANQAVKRRSETQPLGKPSSGCIFKNISLKQAHRLSTPNQTCSAGYLIDQAGLKGKQIGGAKVSKTHANFILNTGSATYKDVKELIELIRQKIKEKYSLDLKLEIFILRKR